MQHRPTSEAIRELPEQRHAGHVSEQVSGHHRCRPFQVVHRDAEVTHHVDQHADHHIGVQRGQQHGGAGRADGQPATGHPGGLIETVWLKLDSPTVAVAGLPSAPVRPNFAAVSR